uniref:Uncharacterized protein n=1 Tax=Heterorhabditis bacteriophora TaxID=37862 RepID=A0A1I7XGL3_HETBA
MAPRSVQNYPTPLPKERWELSTEAKAPAQQSTEAKAPAQQSTEAKAPAQQSTEAKASAQESLKNREKNSPINLLSLKSSNFPSKCIETYRWLGRLRFVSRLAETPSPACSVPQPGLHIAQ